MENSRTFERKASIWRSALVQKRVVGALLMREVITRYGRHNIGFLWLFAEPMLFTLAVTALWTATKSVHHSDLPIVAFAVTGYSSVLLWRNMPSRTIGALQPNLALMYHRNVKPIDIYISRIVLEAAGASISFVVLALVFSLVGWLDPPEDLLKVIGGWLMLALFGAALAMFMGALSERSELIEKLWHPLSYITFPLSGAAFLVDSLPKEAQQVVLLLPMVHGVEYVREGYFGSRIVAHHDLYYMGLVTAGLLVLSLAVIRDISRTVTPE